MYIQYNVVYGEKYCNYASTFCSGTMERVVSEEDIRTIIFSSSETGTRGRPKNTKKLTVSGKVFVPKLSEYKSKDPKTQARFFLRLLVNDESTYKNLLEGSYCLSLAELEKLTRGRLPDMVLDSSFTATILKELNFYWKMKLTV